MRTRTERPSAGSLRPSEVARGLQQGAQRPLCGALVAISVALLFQGCAAWEDHNVKTRDARRSFVEGRFDDALADLEKEKDNKLDGLCFQLDAAVVAQAGGRFDRSNKDFEQAEQTIQEFEDRGLNGSVIAEDIGSIAVNEKTIPYKGEDFEKILVPVMRSRNYLLAGNLEDAMVEARRIWIQQDVTKQLHEKELAESNEEADKHKIDRSKLGEVEGKVEYPPGALKSPESIYEITYAHWLSGIISEKNGKIDDAYISVKAASKIRPDVPFIAADQLRLALIQGDQENASLLRKKWPSLALPGPQDGSIALLFDCGWAPHKRELKIVLPSFNTFGAIAIPLYDRTPNPAVYARLRLNDQVYSTAVLSDVDAIAFKYHHKRLPLMVLKQILRTTIKMAAGEGAAAGVRQGGKSAIGGLAAGLAVGVYNYASEQADLRAWLTLPQTFQAVRVWVPAGTYEGSVELCDAGGNVINAAKLGTITVRPRSLQFAQARSVDRSLFAAICKEAGPPVPVPARGGPKDPPPQSPPVQDTPPPQSPPPPPVQDTPPPPAQDTPPPPAPDAPPPPAPDAPPPSDGQPK